MTLTKKVFHLWNNQDEYVTFEVEPDGSVKSWPFMTLSDLTEADLEKCLAEDLAKGREAVCLQVPLEKPTNSGGTIAQ